MNKLTNPLMAILCLFFVNATYGQNPYERFLPKTDDPELKALFEDPAVEWYTELDQPKVMQAPTHPYHWVSIHKDLGPPQNLFSNGNGEWPWSHPATRQAPTDGRVKAIFGKKVTGRRHFTRPANTRDPHYGANGGLVAPRAALDWQYSTGTEFIEIALNDIEGVDTCFKVLRFKMLPTNEWKYFTYRPWTEKESYEKDTGTKLVYAGRQRMVDSNHSRKHAFDEVAEVWKAPRIDPKLSRKLLDETPFELCTNEFVFTTDYPDQTVPQEYLGPWITNGTDQSRCRNCHRDVGTDVRHFGARDWYFNLRGGGKDKHGAGVFNDYDPNRVGRVYGQ